MSNEEKQKLAEFVAGLNDEERCNLQSYLASLNELSIKKQVVDRARERFVGRKEPDDKPGTCGECNRSVYHTECSKGHKGIVRPDDSCPHGERKDV